MSVPQVPRQRLPQLDVLRCIAVLLVFGAHPAFKWPDGAHPILPAQVWFDIGRSGVDLFFVLSGFLVAGLLFSDYRAHGRLHLKSFFARRGLRIWPAYYLYVAYLCILLTRFGAPSSDFLPFLLHFQNYTPAHVTYAPHLWSLAVEEHFYLLLPVVLVLTVRHWSLRGFAAAAAGVIVASAVLRVLLLPAGRSEPVETHYRLDGLTIGVFLAYVYHFHDALFWRLARPGWWLMPAGAVLVLATLLPGALPTVMPATVANAIVLPMVYTGYAAILLGALTLGRDRKSARFFDRNPARLMAGIGKYSYSIYLWHLEFGFRFTSAIITSQLVVTNVLWLDWTVHTLLYVVCACGGGVLASRCVESPVLALRERWFPSHGAAIDAPATELARV
jgi:peptidoglycan/LPS O-acetylase OafA/YrhL